MALSEPDVDYTTNPNSHENIVSLSDLAVAGWVSYTYESWFHEATNQDEAKLQGDNCFLMEKKERLIKSQCQILHNS
jgi:hypothetical protein